MRARVVSVLGTVIMLLVVSAVPAAAQQRPAAAVEIATGWAGFVDDATIHEPLVSGGFRLYVTPRLSLGPELTYMKGRNDVRQFMLTGNATFDLLGPSAEGRARTTPYLIGGGGLFHQRQEFPSGTFSSSEGAFTAGGGLRIVLSDAAYVAPELRMGWELHLRASVTVGIPLRR